MQLKLSVEVYTICSRPTQLTSTSGLAVMKSSVRISETQCNTKGNGRLLQNGQVVSRRTHEYTHTHTHTHTQRLRPALKRYRIPVSWVNMAVIPVTHFNRQNLLFNSCGPNMPKDHIACISTGHITTGPTGFTYFISPFTKSRTFHTSPLTHDALWAAWPPVSSQAQSAICMTQR